MKHRLLILFLALSTALSAQVERPKWEFGGGVRFNYMGLNGGFSGGRNSDGYSFDIKYKDIGMDNFTPSFAIALGGRFKKWNLEFGGSRGRYEGSFKTTIKMVHDDKVIDSGSVVSGSLDMTMLVLTTNFALIQKKNDLGVGIGILALYMGSDYSTTDSLGREVKLANSQWFPMPFLVIGGRLKFGDFRINGSGGGAFFVGNMSGYHYTVSYLTVDVNGTYEFWHTKRIALSGDIGYRFLYMYLKMDNDQGWYHEKDFYNGPYATLRIKLFSKDLWRPGKHKENKETSPGK
jgi:hypothetical protein